ncbi:MAG: hypothetical protein JWP80_4041 [Pseudomonas sp.]|nr:hypothetical protein [Pseudomonas sp.]
MKTLKSLLTAVAFSLTGAAAHANAATEKSTCGSGICFQLTPLAENGSSHTPQGQWLERQSEMV